MGKRWVLCAVVAATVLAPEVVAAQSWDHDRGWDPADRQLDRELQRQRLVMPAPPQRSPLEWIVPVFISLSGVVVFGTIMVGLTARRRTGYRGVIDQIPPYAYEPLAIVPTGAVDVSVLRIAVDAGAAKFVEDELARINNSYAITSPDGRLATLREVAVMLRRVRDAWIYGGAVNEPLGTWEQARARFARHVDDAEARFTRTDVAATATRAAERTAVLVTIIVAVRGELADVSEIGAGEDLRRALEAAGHRSPDDLMALEIVTSPRMSSLDLEARYPRPDLIRLVGTMAGKIFCDHCGGPFPGELVTCPHCGAPAPGRRAA